MTAEMNASGWSIVAAEDEAAAIIDGVLGLDTDREYTRSELAAAADVPLKTLYLLDTIDRLAAAGMLERVDDGGPESEPRFAVAAESELYRAAVEFDEIFAQQLGDGDRAE